MNNVSRAFLLSIATVLAFSPLARAQGTIKYGDVVVTPRLSLEEKYDDNIFLQPNLPGSQVQGSQIFILGVGSAFTLQGARSRLSLSYDLGILHYDLFSNVNDAVHHIVDGSAAYELANGGKAMVDETFKATTDPASSEVVSRAKRDQNDVTGGVEFPMGAKWYMGASVHHAIYDYLHDPLATTLNRNEFYIGPRIGYKISEKTRTFFEYQYGTIVYDQVGGKNNTLGRYTVGAEGDFTGRLTGGAAVGAQSKSYDTSAPGLTTSATTPSLSAHLKWAAPRDYNVVLTADREFQESVFNRYYTTTNVGVSIGKDLGDRWSANVLGSYGADDYPDAQTVGLQTDTRADKNTSAGLNITYKFPEVYKVTLGYLYRHRSSNFDVFAYKDNVFSLGLGLDF